MLLKFTIETEEKKDHKTATLLIVEKNTGETYYRSPSAVMMDCGLDKADFGKMTKVGRKIKKLMEVNRINKETADEWWFSVCYNMSI